MALAIGRVVLWRPLRLEGPRVDDGFARAAGVVHVHTTFSDGGGSPEEVIGAAQRSGLAFVAITDHNNVDAKRFEGYHGRVLAVVGSEISTTHGHLLGLGITAPAYRFSGEAQDALEDVRDLGGFAVAAHPTSPRADFQWTGWDLPGPWGLELLNGDSEWRGAGSWALFKLGTLYAFNERYALLSGLRAPRAALDRWDRLLARREVSGLVGADAHSRIPIGKRSSVRFPSYEALFALARNHVLLKSPLRGDAAADSRALVEALQGGRSYIALDALAAADSFSFTASAEGRSWTMGETAPPGAGLRLRTQGPLPARARTVLLKDGRVLREAEGPIDLEAPAAGVYRVEVRVPGWDPPWIVTNPIYVLGHDEAEARRVRAAWPAVNAPPPAVDILDSFEGTTIFAPELDPSSSVGRPIVDPVGGVDGKGAAVLRFRLGVPEAGGHTWCALVNRSPRDLSGRSGLRLKVRGDGVYRFWLQVWDANPASAEDGAEWWFASIRTSTEWQDLQVPFARLRSINPRTDGRLDLDKVRALVLIVDRGAAVPGAEGTIWIDDLAAY